MPVHTTLWTYPWDLADETPHLVVSRAKEEVGLSAISVASAYHSFDMLRPHAQEAVRLQVPQSSIYFQPDLALYSAGQIQPHVSPLMGDSNWFDETSSECARHGLELIAWTVCLHNSYLAKRHPDCAELSCTGDLNAARLCPSNAAVRAYAVAMATDLSRNYEISLLECESLSFGGFGHAHYHLKHGVELGAGGRFLMSLCFCAACLRLADDLGLDAEGLSFEAEGRLRRHLRDGRADEEDPASIAEEMPDLKAYVDLREDVVNGLLEEVVRASSVPVSLILMGDRWSAGLNPKRAAEVVSFVEMLAYTPDPEVLANRVRQILSEISRPDKLVVGLQAYPPASPTEEALMSTATKAFDLGIRRLSFYNYGIMPLRNLGWVRDVCKRLQGTG